MLAVPDLDVARALRYMWANFGQSLTVRDVAEAAGICRRKLERCFKTYIGRTVNEELTRKRIERCCELLTTTNKPVAAIASEVGFQTGPYLFRLFRRVTGVTPRQYRLASRITSYNVCYTKLLRVSTTSLVGTARGNRA